MGFIIKYSLEFNLKIFILSFSMFWCTSIFSQKLSTRELTTILLKIDSIEKKINAEQYEKRDFTGKIDSSFGEVRGIVFFSLTTGEIKAIKGYTLMSNDEVDYYCNSNELILIKSPHHIYYFEGQKVFNFSITDNSLKTIDEELAAHFNFYKIIKMTYKND